MADVFGYYDTNRGLLGDALAMDPKYKVNDPATDVPVTDWQAYYQSLSDSGANRMTPGEIANQAEATRALADAQQFGDPSLGTNVYYGLNGPTGLSGPMEHLAPSSTPVMSFLTAGPNYADTGGMKSTNDPALIAELQNDARVRGNQGILKVAALVGGGAAAGYSPWSAGTGSAGTPFQAAGEYGAVSGTPATGAIPAGAVQASGELGGSLSGVGAELGATPFQASGEAGAVPGGSGSIPAGATQASGEYGAGPSWLAKLNQIAKMGGGSSQGQAQSPQFSAPLMPQRSGGGFLQQLVKPRPNYLGRFGDAVMASQSANDLLLKSKLFGRERQ